MSKREVCTAESRWCLQHNHIVAILIGEAAGMSSSVITILEVLIYPGTIRVRRVGKTQGLHVYATCSISQSPLLIILL
jgi:hypothetical protein